MIFFVKVTNISTVHIGKFPVIYIRFCGDISEQVLFVIQHVINVRGVSYFPYLKRDYLAAVIISQNIYYKYFGLNYSYICSMVLAFRGVILFIFPQFVFIKFVQT